MTAWLHGNKQVRMIILATILATTGGLSFIGFYYYECDLNGQFCISGSPLLGPKKDFITIDHYLITTGPNQQYPTILTLWIKNVGSSIANVQYASVTNSTGGYYGRAFGLTIAPGGISNSTLDGSTNGFHFKNGQTYSISVSTMNGQYGFTISY